LRRIVAPGSVVIFDAYPRREETAFGERSMFAAVRAVTATRGEPMIGAFDSAAFAKSIRGKGWRVTDVMKGDAMRRRWFANQPRILWPPRSVLFYTLEAV
jgi:O-methyltransferase involved in polyketide biosynthesis